MCRKEIYKVDFTYHLLAVCRIAEKIKMKVKNIKEYGVFLIYFPFQTK